MRGMTDGPLWQCMSIAPISNASMRSSIAAMPTAFAIPSTSWLHRRRGTYGREIVAESWISGLFAGRNIFDDLAGWQAVRSCNEAASGISADEMRHTFRIFGVREQAVRDHGSGSKSDRGSNSVPAAAWREKGKHPLG